MQRPNQKGTHFFYRVVIKAVNDKERKEEKKTSCQTSFHSWATITATSDAYFGDRCDSAARGKVRQCLSSLAFYCSFLLIIYRGFVSAPALNTAALSAVSERLGARCQKGRLRLFLTPSPRSQIGICHSPLRPDNKLEGNVAEKSFLWHTAADHNDRELLCTYELRILQVLWKVLHFFGIFQIHAAFSSSSKHHN